MSGVFEFTSQKRVNHRPIGWSSLEMHLFEWHDPGQGEVQFRDLRRETLSEDVLGGLSILS
jgi:hypothetical protein